MLDTGATEVDTSMNSRHRQEGQVALIPAVLTGSDSDIWHKDTLPGM